MSKSRFWRTSVVSKSRFYRTSVVSYRLLCPSILLHPTVRFRPSCVWVSVAPHFSPLSTSPRIVRRSVSLQSVTASQVRFKREALVGSSERGHLPCLHQSMERYFGSFILERSPNLTGYTTSGDQLPDFLPDLLVLLFSP